MATAPLNRVLGHLRPSLGLTGDADLLAAFRATRDAAAFEAIVRRHGPTVLNACRQVLRDEADVEDAFQATFLVLFKNAQAIRQGHSLRSWLFGVAHRVSVNARCRRAKREARERTNEELPDASMAGTDLSWREASAILHEELNRLPERLRLPLLLCHIEGKTRDEAAAELGWSLGVVKGLLERGRQRLRRRLEQRGLALSAGLLAAGSAIASVPAQWRDSTIALAHAATGSIRPAVATLARGVLPVNHTRILFALTATIVLGFGTIFATSGDDRPKKEPQAATAKEAAKPMAETIVVSGKIVDAAGKPVADASLSVPYLKRTPPVSEADVGMKVVGKSSADGAFKIEVTPFRAEAGEPPTLVFVTAKGHGAGWMNLDATKATAKVDVTLPADMPVVGRVIDTEGKPIVGAAVRVTSLAVPKDGKLDSFLTAWGNGWQDAISGHVGERTYMPPDGPGGGKTDSTGRFTLVGLGADRIVQIEIDSTSHGKTSVYVITKDGFDAAAINKAVFEKIPIELRIPGQPPTLSGPKVEAVVQANKIIEGTVTDAETGKPVPGIMVSSNSGYNSSVQSTSDKDGRYRLAGLSKHRQYLVNTFTRDKKSNYLSWSARVSDSEGLAPIQHDIKMTRGIVVTGKITDKQTGKPVTGGIRFAPLPDNAFFGTSPAYNGYSSSRMMEDASNGTFRVVTIPGKSALLLQAYSRTAEKIGGVPVNPYRPASPDPDHPKHFSVNGDDITIGAAGNSIEFLSNEHAVKIVDLKPDVPEVTVNLTVDRGATAKLSVVDPDGKPLAGAIVAGLTASWPNTFPLDSDSATVYALNPAKPRTLYLLHPERKLAGTAIVRGDEKEPVVAKLTPAGAITGRLTDSEGQPRPGIAMSLNFDDGPGSELYRHAKLARKPIVTDKDGSFRLDLIVPGVKFYLGMSKGQEYYVGEPKIGMKQVESGKTLDLGAINVKGQRFGQ